MINQLNLFIQQQFVSTAHGRQDAHASITVLNNFPGVVFLCVVVLNAYFMLTLAEAFDFIDSISELFLFT